MQSLALGFQLVYYLVGRDFFLTPVCLCCFILLLISLGIIPFHLLNEFCKVGMGNPALGSSVEEIRS